MSDLTCGMCGEPAYLHETTVGEQTTEHWMPCSHGRVALRHDPTVMTGGRTAWATCSCGWRSSQYPTAQLATATWAAHLAVATTPHPSEQPVPHAGDGEGRA